MYANMHFAFNKITCTSRKRLALESEELVRLHVCELCMFLRCDRLCVMRMKVYCLPRIACAMYDFINIEQHSAVLLNSLSIAEYCSVLFNTSE